MKHTPGPWKTAFFDGTQICIRSVDDLVAVVYAYEEKKEEGEANARLIAASPELLGALENLTFVNDKACVVPVNPAEWQQAWDMALVAIAKAEGE